MPEYYWVQLMYSYEDQLDTHAVWVSSLHSKIFGLRFFFSLCLYTCGKYGCTKVIGVFTNDGNQKLVFYPVPLFMMKMGTENTVAGDRGN